MNLEIPVQLAPMKLKGGKVGSFDIYPAEQKLILEIDGDYYVTDIDESTGNSEISVAEFPELKAIDNGKIVRAKLVIEYERQPGWYRVKRCGNKQVAQWDGEHWETIVTGNLSDEDFEQINEIPINMED
jgi:hypothetical protein